MKLTLSLAIASAVSIGSARAINEAAFEGPVLEPRQNPGWSLGSCYSSAGDLTKNATNIPWQTSHACITSAGNHKVIALTDGTTCYYGDSLPPDSDKVDNSKCQLNCDGYPGEKCGGQGTFLVWTNGQVSSSSGGSSSSSGGNGDDDSSSSAPTATQAPSVQVTTAVAQGTTIIYTQTPDATAAAATVSVTSSSSADNNGSGTNKAAVAAGVVVGVVGLAAIVGGAFLFWRSRKQRQEAADLHRQSSSAGFASRAEKPSSTYSAGDSRLEPAFMRRMSDGSIADNQDYSRRILKVTNPDDR